MRNFTLISSVIYAILAVGANAVCNSGEVGIGANQLCQIGNPNGGGSCSGAQGTIYANDCNFIATGSESGYCSGGWPSGYNVQCNGNTPTYVTTTGGDFSNCYQVSGSGDCSSGPYSYDFVDYCCSPV